MRIRISFLVAALVIVGLCAACNVRVDYDIRGEWAYTMATEDGNTYDTGTITFTGEPEKGSYIQLNVYDVDYGGDYTVKGTTVRLLGDESWQGIVTSATQMSGTWVHEGESKGTWTAIKP